MTIEYSKFRPVSGSALPTNPIDIFRSCRISDGDIKDLWIAQGDALREYHKHRDRSDISIVLNTGAGKTLVGLLVAQSLLNESSRQVVYSCSSKQLIEQTREKALGYGLDVTTYQGGQFSDDGYENGHKICLTTYHALFNGKTRFRKDDIAAIVFDDAHTADHILRDQFTLTVDRRNMEGAYIKLLSLFKAFHEQIGLSSSYAELQEGTSDRIFWVPPSVFHKKRDDVLKILRAANLRDEDSTKFAWDHLKDHIDLCCLLLSERAVTLTPPFIPISTFPYFSGHVRRVYLSATLDTPDSFARTFGRKPSRKIAPDTAAGKCERMILIPSMSQAIQHRLEHGVTQAFLQEQKALILVPSYARAERWDEIADLPERESTPTRVREFRDSDPDCKEKLLLAGRYDGIDLPGDTCRVLVIDDLPTGSSQLERFLWERLGMKTALGGTITSRLIQSFGRISRGLGDFGIIILTGERLVKWLRTSRNLDLIPAFLRAQIELGFQVSAELDLELDGAAKACLGRRSDWIDTHAKFVEKTGDGVRKGSPDNVGLVEVALAEDKYMDYLWDMDFESAARAIGDSLRKTMEVSDRIGAWHMVWRGYALERAGDSAGAEELYQEAHAAVRSIPYYRPPVGSERRTASAQVRAIVDQITLHRDGVLGVPKKLRSNLAALGGGSSAEVEEALRYLGLYLGFESSRPDKENGSGPDVLWMVDDDVALCMEAKTDKHPTSEYRKRDIGQLHNHVEWVRSEKGDIEIIPIFVGPICKSTEKASASESMVVIEIESFKAVADMLVSTLDDVAGRALPITLDDEMGRGLEDAELLWPRIFERLPKARFRDLVP